MSAENAGKVQVSERALLAAGLVSAAVGFVFLPVVFGPLALVCGVAMFVKYNEMYGLALVALGLLSTVIGYTLPALLGLT